jgi:hypothetical protein
MPQRSRWRARRPSALLAGVAVALVLAGTLAGPAAAAPSDQPGGTTRVLDSEALDELQRRAAEVQADLLARQGEVVAAQEALTAAEEAAQQAEAAVADVEGELAGHQAVVADYASAVYRDA